jgi:hypothetical protein
MPIERDAADIPAVMMHPHYSSIKFWKGLQHSNAARPEISGLATSTMG